MELSAWLRRRRPTRIVCQPSGKEWPTPSVRPWSQLAELAGDAVSVEAYREGAFLGVFSRPNVNPPPPAGVPDRGGASPVAAAAAELLFRAEIDGLREIVRMQQAMLREIVSSQATMLRAIRATAGATPPAADDDGADGADELDDLLRATLARSVGGGADTGNGSTADMLRAVLAQGLAK